MERARWCAWAGVVVCIVVAVHEWYYRGAHPHAAGPSGWIAALAVGAALGCYAVARIADTLIDERRVDWTRLRTPESPPQSEKADTRP